MARYLVVDGPGEADRNKDGRLSATELSLSTLHLALFIAGFLVGLVGLVKVWQWGRFGPFFFLLDVAATGACFVGCWRHYAVVDRALRWQSADRARAIEQAEYDRQYREGLTSEVKDRITQAEVDTAVELILSCYFAEPQKPWQRGKVHGLSDVRWNIANDTLKKAGLRKGRADRLEAETFEAAWATYLRWRRSDMRAIIGDDGEIIRD